MTPTRALTITVPEGLYGRFVEMARKQGMTPAVYGKLLFEAAYSARCGATGDRELDAAVAAIDAPSSADPEAVEHLRQRHQAALDAATKWQAEAVEQAKNWCQAAADRDDARREIKELEQALRLERQNASRIADDDRRSGQIRKQEREAYDETVGQLSAEVERLREQLQQELARNAQESQARIAAERQRDEHMISLGVVEDRCGDLARQLEEAREKCDALHEAVAERDARLSALEARIAAATMIPISHPETATLAEAGGGMEETAAARRLDQPKAVSSPIPSLTADQAKRARAYRAGGMTPASIAAAMKVEAAAVRAALKEAR